MKANSPLIKVKSASIKLQLNKNENKSLRESFKSLEYGSKKVETLFIPNEYSVFYNLDQIKSSPPPINK